MHQIEVLPIGRRIEVADGSPLRDALFDVGVEFPCGGTGRCRGCRVRVRAGEAPCDDFQRTRLTAEEIHDGWRLACRLRAASNLTIEIRQWDAAILADDAGFTFTPQEGWGVAVDLGTTTVVAQLIDLVSGQVLAVRTALNPQARFGSDVMSRVQYGLTSDGAAQLRHAIRSQIAGMIKQMLIATARSAAESSAPSAQLRRVVIVGNTVMHHAYCGLDLEPLSRYPFESEQSGRTTFRGADVDIDGGHEIGAHHASDAVVEFLPCLGSFVGSDILAGIVAAGIADSDELTCLLDLGTNGEIVLGNRERMLCASTAAGPAFEGARISSGMRAASGAIWKVEAGKEGGLSTEVIGGGAAQGICGSGLVDAAAVCLDLGRIKPSGRLSCPGPLLIADGVALTQADIRELQLAKGAIAAGIELLLSRWGATLADVSRVVLAGAFGNYIDKTSASRIGLIPFDLTRVSSAGNTALLGAKIALGAPHSAALCEPILAKTTHIGLSADPAFQDTYVEQMPFP